MARAKQYFVDVLGDNRSYSKGDPYPAAGVSVSPERVKQLQDMGLITADTKTKTKKS